MVGVNDFNILNQQNKDIAISLAEIQQQADGIVSETLQRRKGKLAEENVSLKKQIKTLKSILAKVEFHSFPKNLSDVSTLKKDSVKQNQKSTSKGETDSSKSRDKISKAPTKAIVETSSSVNVGKLDFRIGKILSVEKHPDADSLYVEKVDVFEVEPRTVVSGLVKHISAEDLNGRLVVLLCNLKPAKMRGIVSQAMVMCASTPEKVEVLVPPEGSVPGDLVSFEGFVRNPEGVLNPKKKIFETLAPDLVVDEARVATYKGVPFFVEGKGKVHSPTLANVQVK